MTVTDPSSCGNFEEFAVGHVDLDWFVDFERRLIEGSAVLTVKALKKAEKLILDVSDLSLESVTCDGRALEFRVESNGIYGQKLEVDLGKVEEGEERKVKFVYKTSANAGALQFMSKEMTKDKLSDYLYGLSCYTYGRSIVPSMDSPAVKQTISAKVSVPSEMNCLMSAICTNKNLDGPRAIFEFRQTVPIPVYLLAFVVGRVEKKDISDRCAVWAEPSVVESAAYEFADTEKMLKAAEELAGPYVWGRYDLVVLPPSFPFGGMENPCLTFVTPSLLAGDRSLANVVAHEIAHSWTGNLVTNATWEHYWLNEGFTVYLERMIMGKLYGDNIRQLHAVIGWEDRLLPCIHKTFNPEHELTKLVTDLQGMDPNEIYSETPYEKGSAFLLYLEQQLGADGSFLDFLRRYIDEFKGKSITSDQWRRYLETFFAAKEKVLESIEFDKWLHAPGVPPAKPEFDDSLVQGCRRLAERWIRGTDAEVEAITDQEFQKMSTIEKIKTLQCLVAAEPLPGSRVARISDVYGLLGSNNCRLKFAFLQVALKARWIPAVPHVLQFVTDYGMLSYIKKLYKELFEWPEVRTQAIERFEKNEPTMHPFSAGAIRKLI
uniref:Leuk-A4-hydro_C domain-containing protein n=1 Tax=Steinernema glaseri TaxID=37863 RepID=A0A1I7YMX4_9BILA